VVEPTQLYYCCWQACHKTVDEHALSVYRQLWQACESCCRCGRGNWQTLKILRMSPDWLTGCMTVVFECVWCKWHEQVTLTWLFHMQRYWGRASASIQYLAVALNTDRHSGSARTAVRLLFRSTWLPCHPVAQHISVPVLNNIHTNHTCSISHGHHWSNFTNQLYAGWRIKCPELCSWIKSKLNMIFMSKLPEV